MTSTNALPIFIGHNDTLLNLYLPERGNERNFFTRSDQGHIDLPRAREAGIGGGFFAVFVPPDPSMSRSAEANLIITDTGYEVRMQPALDLSYAQRVTIALTAGLFRLEAESKGQVKVVRSTGELVPCLRESILAAILHFEGAEAMDPGRHGLVGFYPVAFPPLVILRVPPTASHPVPHSHLPHH